MKRQILKNICSNYATSFLGIALGFLMVPFLIHKLGKDAFGLIILAESAIAFFEVVTVNIRMALARTLTFSLSQGKEQEFDEFLATGQVLFLCSAAFVFCAGSAVSAWFPSLFQVPEPYRLQSKVLFFCVAASFSGSVLFMVYWSLLYARHRFDLIHFSSSAGVLLRAILLLALFSVPGNRFVSLVTYGLAYLAMGLAQNALVYSWHKRVTPGIRIRLGGFRKDKAREILGYSGYLSLNRASSLLDQNLSNILINLFWGSASNALYAIASKVPSVLGRFFEGATWTLTSAFNEFVAKKEHGKLTELFFFYTKAMAILTTPFCVFLAFFADGVVRAWVGPEFELSGRLMRVLLIPLFLQLPLSISGCLINSHGQVKVPCIVSLGVAACNVALGVLLGRGLGFGLLGMAASASACNSLYSLLFSSVYACRISRIPVREYWLKAFLAPALWSALVSGAAFAGVRALADADRTLAAAALAAAFFAFYYFSAYAWVLNEGQKRRVGELAASALAFAHGLKRALRPEKGQLESAA